MSNYLFFDIESHNAGTQYSIPPEQFMRLFQYAWGNGPVHTTTDYDEALNLIREADYVVGHNIHSFDLSVLFGTDSMEPLQMAIHRRVVDTLCLAALLKPAPGIFTTRNGHTFYDGQKPEKALKWLSLDNLAYQFDLPGKMGDLKALAKKHNPDKTPVGKLDFSLIPVDDEEFLSYAEGDITAVRSLFHFLTAQAKTQNYPSDYLWREQLIYAIQAQITRNGITVDQDEAQSRVDHLAERRDGIMHWLVKQFDFPTEGKQPWKSAAGKGSILKAFDSYGIHPGGNDDWPRTPKGAPSFSGTTLIAVSEGTEAEELGQALAELQGQRSLAQLALDSVHPDGKAHPDITSLQRSSRWSFTKPGLTVWTARGDNAVEKRYFRAEEGKVFAELDFSAADARAMAALSGDPEFARRFEEDDDGNPVHDSHNLTGEALFGYDTYYERISDNGKPLLRPVSKASGHAQNYNIGFKKLADTLNKVCKSEGIEMEFSTSDAKGMIRSFNEKYPWLKLFKDRAVEEGDRLGYVTNPWGRRMPVDKDRSYTQSPALYGQSVTREMMADSLVRIVMKGPRLARTIKAIIHDALLVELDDLTAEADVATIKECMEHDFDPKTKTGAKINFPVGVGPLGENWFTASHD